MGLYEDVPDDKLTPRELVNLERSEDPADIERAQRVSAPLRAALSKTAAGWKPPKFEIAKPPTFDFADQLRRQQAELNLSMEGVHEALAARAARQAEAEDATIESTHLLDALVTFASAQSAQLATMSTLLEAVTSQVAASAERDEARWPRTWLVMKWTLVAGAIAGLGAVGAIVVTLIK